MGGIEMNEHAQVIDLDGDIIEGLYAAGEITGGDPSLTASSSDGSRASR